MGYLPGPLILQSADNVGIEVTDYKLTDYAAGQLGGLDATLGSWDPLLYDAGVLMSEPSDPIAGVDIDGAMNVLNAHSDPESAMGLNAIAFALGTADLAFASAIGFAPAEAWMDSSTPFVAPVPAETLGVPIIPPGFIATSVSGNVVGETPPPTFNDAGGPISVTLTNLTQYGSASFRIGDSFQLVATGSPLAVVSVYATLNGQNIGGGVQGELGFDGKFTIVGTMGDAQVGVWTEDWYVGNSLAGSFSFVVVG